MQMLLRCARAMSPPPPHRHSVWSACTLCLRAPATCRTMRACMGVCVRARTRECVRAC